jgi:hypothetical protein
MLIVPFDSQRSQEGEPNGDFRAVGGSHFPHRHLWSLEK